MAKTLQRIQRLFQRGEVLRLGDDVVVWVGKLNAFEKDEALKDARHARALRMVAFDRDEDQQVQVQVVLNESTDRDLQESLLQRKAGELLVRADDEVRADEKWKERLEILDRAPVADDGRTSEQEQKVLLDLVVEYEKAVSVLHQRFMRDELQDLKKQSRDELEKAYLVAWREMLGNTAFYEAKRQSELWYSLHECTVSFDEDGDPLMETLVVGERLCEGREEVNTLPDEVVVKALRVLDGEMTPREAGNSDAPSASSGSSEQRSAAEESVPSTPTGM